jgi:hypothetical protein
MDRLLILIGLLIIGVIIYCYTSNDYEQYTPYIPYTPYNYSQMPYGYVNPNLNPLVSFNERYGYYEIPLTSEWPYYYY